MSRYVLLSPVGSTVVGTDTPPAEAWVRGDKAGLSMEQGCKSLVEPRYQGVHDLMVRLLGRCTCENDARVVELYTAAGVEREEHREHVSA